jgi:dihydroorotate dehydrogenase (NAD+) catalytic subunit
VEYMLCGATAVQVGTAAMDGSLDIYGEVAEGIGRYLKENGFGEVGEIVGLAREA